MPVRLLSSSVLRWPDGEAVRQSVRSWARETLAAEPLVVRVGYRGSYATGQEGVGSDLDLIVIMKTCPLPFERRGLLFHTSSFPVPCDLLVYTERELEGLLARDDRFARELRYRTVWF